MKKFEKQQPLSKGQQRAPFQRAMLFLEALERAKKLGLTCEFVEFCLDALLDGPPKEKLESLKWAINYANREWDI